MRNVFRWIGLILITTWAALAAAQADPGGGGGGTTSASADYRLGPGDQIRVQVYQNPDLTVETRVSEQGTINAPLSGNVQLGGTTIGDVLSDTVSVPTWPYWFAPQHDTLLLPDTPHVCSVPVSIADQPSPCTATRLACES